MLVTSRYVSDIISPTSISRQVEGINLFKSSTRFTLPDYVLDFGPVIIGDIRSHVIHISNPDFLPVSFHIDHSNLFQTGFFCELDRVKMLPMNETVDFKFTFDPRGALLDIGPIEAVVPINILDGPIIHLRVRADVTMPSLDISNNQIDFGKVECGKCKGRGQNFEIFLTQIFDQKFEFSNEFLTKCDFGPKFHFFNYYEM